MTVRKRFPNLKEVVRDLKYKPLHRGETFQQIREEFRQQIEDEYKRDHQTSGHYQAARKEIARYFLKKDSGYLPEWDEQMNLNGLNSVKLVKVITAIGTACGFKRSEIMQHLAHEFFNNEATYCTLRNIASEPVLDYGLFIALDIDEDRSRAAAQATSQMTNRESSMEEAMGDWREAYHRIHPDKEITSRHPE